MRTFHFRFQLEVNGAVLENGSREDFLKTAEDFGILENGRREDILENDNRWDILKTTIGGTF